MYLCWCDARILYGGGGGRQLTISRQTKAELCEQNEPFGTGDQGLEAYMSYGATVGPTRGSQVEKLFSASPPLILRQ